ncbi:MAG TPA: TolC family protein [Gemmatimonadales bacterium]|nr:TolC family protein [Gemmatimonadales bacterium]
MLLALMALLLQQPVTRADAVTAALTRGARVGIGRADTTAALGAVRTARAFPNPTLSGSYTKDTPNYHALGDLPLDLPWLRAPRIGAAEAARDAARYQFAFDRAAVQFDVDTTYTRALATAMHARLSRRTADDADSLRKIAQLRRDVGDVSELDVRLAAVNAGQLENAAVDDSLAAVGTLLSLQLQMGLGGDQPSIVLVDSLITIDSTGSGAGGAGGGGAAAPARAGEYFPIAAATARLRAAERTLTFTRASRFAPSFEFGVDKGDPANARPQELLPVIGFSLPFPLFNRSGGAVTQAIADRDRARVELDQTRRETDAAVARANRELVAARARVRRSAALVASADRIAAMSLQAYGEGAIPLANVLEAQRNAREILARYIDDLAAADAAARMLRWLTAGGGPAQ